MSFGHVSQWCTRIKIFDCFYSEGITLLSQWLRSYNYLTDHNVNTIDCHILIITLKSIGKTEELKRYMEGFLDTRLIFNFRNTWLKVYFFHDLMDWCCMMWQLCTLFVQELSNYRYSHIRIVNSWPLKYASRNEDLSISKLFL